MNKERKRDNHRIHNNHYSTVDGGWFSDGLEVSRGNKATDFSTSTISQPRGSLFKSSAEITCK